jgi:hypothetical protein
MLTKQQFLEKHKVKFSGLNSKELDKRYSDYRLSKAMRKNNGGAPVPKTSKAAPGQLSYSTLSRCAKLYVHALLDPWSLNETPCVPDNITLPSYKFSARYRGTVVVGTSGIGFVAVDPYLFCTSDKSIAWTDATYAFPGVEFGIVGVNETPSDSAYPIAQFNPTNPNNLTLRVVGFGMRMRYTGSEMSRSGQLISYRQPENRQVPHPYPPSFFLSNREAVTVPADRAWHSCLWRPALPRDLAYFEPFSDLTALEYSNMIVISGGVPGTSFEIDLVGWYELIGNTLPNLTRSHSDPLGMSVVSASLSEKQPTTSNSVRDFIANATSIANESLSFVKAVGPVVKTGLEIAALL